MMKRMFHMLVLIALTNLFALIGLVGYMFATGRLSEKRINQIAMVLRGEFPEETEGDEVAAPDEDETPNTSAEEIARKREQAQFYSLLSEHRRRAEEDQRKLNEQLRLDLQRRQEQLASREQRVESQAEAIREESELSGFRKQMEMLEKTDPEMAKNLLMNMDDADVVHLMVKMDTNRVPKIINACRTDEELGWIGRILNQIGKVKEEQANGVDGPSASTTEG